MRLLTLIVLDWSIENGVLLHPNACISNWRLRIGVGFRLIIHKRRELSNRLVNGHVIRQHIVANHKLQFMLERCLRHNHGGHTIINILFGIFFGVDTNAGIAAHDQIAFDCLHQSQWIDLDRTAFPLAQICAIGMTLQIAFQLMCIEKFKCTCVRTTEEIVNFHRKLFQLRDTTV